MRWILWDLQAYMARGEVRGRDGTIYLLDRWGLEQAQKQILLQLAIVGSGGVLEDLEGMGDAWAEEPHPAIDRQHR